MKNIVLFLLILSSIDSIAFAQVIQQERCEGDMLIRVSGQFKSAKKLVLIISKLADGSYQTKYPGDESSVPAVEQKDTELPTLILTPDTGSSKITEVESGKIVTVPVTDAKTPTFLKALELKGRIFDEKFEAIGTMYCIPVSGY